MSLNAYKATIRECESPRQIERRILATVTGRLAGYAQEYESAADSHARQRILASGLRSALIENQRLWKTMSYDLAQSTNALPNSLRAAIISIGLWVDRQTNLIVGGGGQVHELVEVNANIIRGLATTPRPGN